MSEIHERFTQTALPTLLVIGPLDPVDDCCAKLCAGGPPAPVEDVLLQHSEERFHRRIVSSGTDSAHRGDQSETFQRLLKFSRPEL